MVWGEAEIVRDSLGKPVSIVGTVQDITDRKGAEEELIRLVTALESAADAVVITDSAMGIIQYVNPAFEQLTGYEKGEALGRDIHLLDSGRHDQAFYHQLRGTLKEEGFWAGRLVQKRKDGTLYEEECTYSLVKNSDGEIINYISIKRDVTEKARLESIAQSVEMVNNIGYIFAGVSHEIGTPVNTIGMSLDMIRKNLDMLPREKIAEYVDRAQTQVSRVLYLLRNLRNFNMYESLQPSTIKVSSFLDGFLSMVKEDFEKKGISIGAVLEQDAKSVHADPRALQQVLLNIFTNAFDALEGRDDPKIDITVAAATDSLVRIRVSDNGRGIEETRMKDIFKPFYTTKKHGTGLGLVIIKKMVARMDGTVDVTSRLNEGTAVEICLPSIVSQ